MATTSQAEQILQDVAATYRGTGGATAIIKDGNVLAKHVWGYADVDERTPVTAETIMPICSITKQLLCGTLIQLEQQDGGEMRSRLQARLEKLLGDIVSREDLLIQHLCDNQSGLRDYWAAGALVGARPETPFTIAKDAPAMLERLRHSLHFAPGTEYSYCNLNYYIIGELLEAETGEQLHNLLTKYIFEPAGMKTAQLSPDTAKLPGPCKGYEGDEKHGYQQAHNAIEWAGDAGSVACLNDMIAYEQYFDQEWADKGSWVQISGEQRSFKGGKPAAYGYGLARGDLNGAKTLGHGGALRGYRLHRVYVPDERLSAVVMFNHEADSQEAAETILKRMLKTPDAVLETFEASGDWAGNYLDEETGLFVGVESGGSSQILLSYDRHAEKVQLAASNRASSKSMDATAHGDSLSIQRHKENRLLQARRIPKTTSLAIHGSYECVEIQSVLHCEGDGLVMYGSFDGFLGRGPASLMRHIEGDVWALTCARSLDAPPPGDWTCQFHRGKDGEIESVTVGCWLARKLQYKKI